MRAIITGGYGFVGRHLADELAGSGYEVSVVDIAGPSGVVGVDGFAGAGGPAGAAEADGENGMTRVAGVNGATGPDEPVQASPDAAPKGVTYRRCDLLDYDAINRLIGEFAPDVIFHLAAQSSAAVSFDDPKWTLETNILGTLGILESLRKLTKSGFGRSMPVRLLSIGSCEEYGKRAPGEMPLGEGSPVEPVSPYAVSKAAQTMLVFQYARAYDLDVIATRSFSHTGPGQTDRFVLPSFAKQCAEIAAELKEPVIKVGNLDVVRDFLDVRDVARAYRMLAEKGTGGAVYNVCSGDGLNLNDALQFMVNKVSKDIRIEKDPNLLRPADVPVLMGNNELLRADTGWERRIHRDRMLSDLVEYWERKIVPASP